MNSIQTGAQKIPIMSRMLKSCILDHPNLENVIVTFLIAFKNFVLDESQLKIKDFLIRKKKIKKKPKNSKILKSPTCKSWRVKS